MIAELPAEAVEDLAKSRLLISTMKLGLAKRAMFDRFNTDMKRLFEQEATK